MQDLERKLVEQEQLLQEKDKALEEKKEHFTRVQKKSEVKDKLIQELLSKSNKKTERKVLHKTK